MILSETGFGYWSYPSSDVIRIKLKFNPSTKCKWVNVNPNLTISDLKGFIATLLSKRQELSLCNGIDDALGLTAPFITKLKLLMCWIHYNRINLSLQKGTMGYSNFEVIYSKRVLSYRGRNC